MFPRSYNCSTITNLSFLGKAKALAIPEVQFFRNQGSPTLFRSLSPCNPTGPIPEQPRLSASVLKIAR